LEAFKLSIEKYGNNWFGCLVDDRDRLVSSAFGPSSKAVQDHLFDYSNNIGGRPARVENRLTHEMIRLYDGDTLSKRISFNEDHVSKFQRKVYRVLERIPKGRVTTYGLISKHLLSAPRAVGGAVASNPWPLFIPCERVVNFDLTIGNYGQCGSLRPSGTVTKRSLLERENVPILVDRVDRKAVWDPSGKNR
jgi:methylated-DNA-[protein]-cysteine S-methyltransferase